MNNIITPYFIRFTNPITGKFLGEFKESNGVLSFEGNVDESAKLFVDFVCNELKKRQEERLMEHNEEQKKA